MQMGVLRLHRGTQLASEWRVDREGRQPPNGSPLGAGLGSARETVFLNESWLPGAARGTLPRELLRPRAGLPQMPGGLWGWLPPHRLPLSWAARPTPPAGPKGCVRAKEAQPSPRPGWGAGEGCGRTFLRSLPVPRGPPPPRVLSSQAFPAGTWAGGDPGLRRAGRGSSRRQSGTLAFPRTYGRGLR